MEARFWGCRPNNKPVTAVETLQTPSIPALLPPADETAITTVSITATVSASASEDDDDAASGGGLKTLLKVNEAR